MIAVPAGRTRRIGALAWPLLIGQLAVIANGVIDTAMTSRFSSADLAALADQQRERAQDDILIDALAQASPSIVRLSGVIRKPLSAVLQPLRHQPPTSAPDLRQRLPLLHQRPY